MKKTMKTLFFALLFCMSINFAFAQEDTQENIEECEGLLELEMRHIQLEEYVIENDLEVPAPEAREITEGVPSCDEQLDVVTDRNEQLEEYLEENGLEVPEEPSEEEQAALKAKMEEAGQENREKGVGSQMAAEKSEGMPSCEADVAALKQRIADLEKYIEENGLELPEPSEEEQAAMEQAHQGTEEGSQGTGSEIIEEQNKVERDENENPPQGFFKGVFKKMFGFFGGEGPVEGAPEVIPETSEEEVVAEETTE